MTVWEYQLECGSVQTVRVPLNQVEPGPISGTVHGWCTSCAVQRAAGRCG